MNSFISLISKKKINHILRLEKENKCNYKELINNYLVIKSNTIKKFEKDKGLFESNNLVIFIEGVILNLKSLFLEYKFDNLETLIEGMYFKDGEKFFNRFRGSFCGLIYDKRDGRTIVFTNHIGDKQVFFYEHEDFIVVSSNIDNINRFLKDNNVKITLNENAAYELLTYGFMTGSNTLIKEISKLEAGTYIKFNEKLEIYRYHKFTNELIKDITEDEAIDRIDILFRNAVKMEFEKDLEYGYKHLCNLSGGLDSRMINCVARDLGYDNILNITYCKNNYLDELIAKQISTDLGNEFLFKSLDDVSFIYDIDDVVRKNGAMSCYSALTGGKNFFETINFSRYGLNHTGQLGDVVIGTFCTKAKHLKPINILGTYSNILIDKLDKKHLNKYESEEIYQFYTRGFTGCLNSHSLTQEFTEVSSPFLDIDLMEFCLSINPEMRINHNLYIKWIMKKYPNASKYKWEKIDGKIYTNKKLLKIKSKIKRSIISIINGQSEFYNMNPFEYWYKTNINMSRFMDKYFKDNIEKLNNNKELKEDAIKMYNTADAREKTQVLTLLAFLKVF
ncbi:hypothetical protein [Clostridium hydrogeniformans]|uniref:hypothetical protein n=1 Tax=Clostridium hydrogeniformans TaxID=349933 RepID=UPI000487DF90|nr:hypothetical protein [Clostridium hydrogeniformans]